MADNRKTVEGTQNTSSAIRRIASYRRIYHEKLTYRFNGRDMRLTDVHGVSLYTGQQERIIDFSVFSVISVISEAVY